MAGRSAVQWQVGAVAAQQLSGTSTRGSSGTSTRGSRSEGEHEHEAAADRRQHTRSSVLGIARVRIAVVEDSVDVFTNVCKQQQQQQNTARA